MFGDCKTSQDGFEVTNVLNIKTYTVSCVCFVIYCSLTHQKLNSFDVIFLFIRLHPIKYLVIEQCNIHQHLRVSGGRQIKVFEKRKHP